MLLEIKNWAAPPYFDSIWKWLPFICTQNTVFFFVGDKLICFEKYTYVHMILHESDKMLGCGSLWCVHVFFCVERFVRKLSEFWTFGMLELLNCTCNSVVDLTIRDTHKRKSLSQTGYVVHNTVHTYRYAYTICVCQCIDGVISSHHCQGVVIT